MGLIIVCDFFLRFLYGLFIMTIFKSRNKTEKKNRLDIRELLKRHSYITSRCTHRHTNLYTFCWNGNRNASTTFGVLLGIGEKNER